MTAKIRKHQYVSRSQRSGGTSSRAVSGENLSKALDRALDLYKATWGKYQDIVELKYSGTYIFD